MRSSLYIKLTLAFMLVAVCTAGLVAIYIRVTSADRLSQFIFEQQRSSLQQSLVNYYAANQSWDNLSASWDQLQAQFSPTPNAQSANGGRFPDNGANPPPDRPHRSLFGMADAQGIVITSIDRQYPAGTTLPAATLKSGTPVLVDGKQVGTILTIAQLPTLNPEETLFLERTNQALIFAILGALLAALVVGGLLARTLTLPLRALTHAAQGITRGELKQQVRVTSRDEIGQLAHSFNLMSQEVARVNQLRRQMTADIAHDLRTPLTVISGYVESMRDGVLAPTPERLSLIYAEIERLQNMVGDLRMLSQADAGELKLNLQHISPQAILERAAALFEHKAGQQEVDLVMETSASLPEVMVDEARMMQVMDNLISNALRYTPNGGKITLLAFQNNDKVVITVRDTGSGIAQEELQSIFDRFYRADSSRHSETGEIGLGLAIVKALVETHGGRVWAESTPGEGASIFVELGLA